MFIFGLLNIMVGQKISYNDKERSSAWKDLGAKSACLQKIVLYFKGVTVKTVDHSQQSRSLHFRDKRHK